MEQVEDDIRCLLGVLGVLAHGVAEPAGAQIHTPQAEDKSGQSSPHRADDDVDDKSETDEATGVEAIEYQRHADLDDARGNEADVGHCKIVLSIDVR